MHLTAPHEQRLADLDEEIGALDRQTEGETRRRRGNPTGDAAERVMQAELHRARLTNMRAQIEGDIAAIRAHECNPARVAHRASGRDALDGVVGMFEQRLKVAKTMDRAANIFLAAVDEMNKLGAIAEAGVREAAQAAVPFNSGLMDASDNTRLMDQRRLMLETTAPHAGSFTGPDMKYAMVLFIAQILDRVENPKGIAEIARGWQFTPGETSLPFVQAAQQAHERMEQGAVRIAEALVEPK